MKVDIFVGIIFIVCVLSIIGVVAGVRSHNEKMKRYDCLLEAYRQLEVNHTQLQIDLYGSERRNKEKDVILLNLDK